MGKTTTYVGFDGDVRDYGKIANTPTAEKARQRFQHTSTTGRIKVTESIPPFNGIRNELASLIWQHFPENQRLSHYLVGSVRSANGPPIRVHDDTGEERMAVYTIKPLVTATAVNTGGRNGHSETTDHSVSVNLSVRKEMGGPGLPDTTTPEHLFAAGYAACFGGAIEFVAHQQKKNIAGTVVTCSTSVGPREGGGFGIAVTMHVGRATMPL
jgi:lipoyl-dependent peroxiredoxin